MRVLALLLFFTVMSQDRSSLIYDFTQNDNKGQWFIVDDGVMGGLSQGNINIDSNGHGVFKGYVTTENNGGFSSVHYKLDKKDVTPFSTVVIKLKGDGKKYQFRIKRNTYQRFSYTNSFETSGDWETIKLAFNDFVPMFRGYKLNEPNYAGEVIAEIAFLIGNKRNESFSLEIEKIYLE